MGFINFTRGVAQNVDALGQAITAPRREREIANRRAEQARRAKEAERAAQRNRDEAIAEAQVTAEATEIARPGQERTADSAFQRTETGLDNETDRTIQRMDAQGRVMSEDVLPAVTKGNVAKVDAEAKGDVSRQAGYRENILEPQMEILGMTQAHDMATQRNFIGDTPLTPQLLAENQKDREFALELNNRAQQDPMRWVDAAARLAATAGLILS